MFVWASRLLHWELWPCATTTLKYSEDLWDWEKVINLDSLVEPAFFWRNKLAIMVVKFQNMKLFHDLVPKMNRWIEFVFKHPLLKLYGIAGLTAKILDVKTMPDVYGAFSDFTGLLSDKVFRLSFFAPRNRCEDFVTHYQYFITSWMFLSCTMVLVKAIWCPFLNI